MFAKPNLQISPQCVQYLGPQCILFKTNFWLNPWAEASVLSIKEANEVFLTYKGPSRTRKAHFGGPKLLRLSCFRDFENHFLNNSRETHRKLHTSFIPRCQTQSRAKAKITISLKDYFHFSGLMHLTVSYSSDSIVW